VVNQSSSPVWLDMRMDFPCAFTKEAPQLEDVSEGRSAGLSPSNRRTFQRNLEQGDRNSWKVHDRLGGIKGVPSNLWKNTKIRIAFAAFVRSAPLPFRSVHCVNVATSDG